MKDDCSMIDRPVARTVLLFALLLLVGFATRFPALAFPQFYALHGVLAAPFFSAIAYWHFGRKGTALELFAAVLALAAVLGAMSVVMGLSFLVLALCLLAACALSSSLRFERQLPVRATLFGLLDYPCALASGVALGSYAFSGEAWVIVGLLLVLSLALALFAVLLFGCFSTRLQGRGR